MDGIRANGVNNEIRQNPNVGISMQQAAFTTHLSKETAQNSNLEIKNFADLFEAIKQNKLSTCIHFSKAFLFLICAWSLTLYSRNPKQLEIKHLYSDIEWLYFTNISLYITLATVIVGTIYRVFNRLHTLYNIMLPLAITLEIIVTFTFWGLYFYDPKLIKNHNHLKPGYETPLLQELGLHFFPLILLLIDQIGVKLFSTWMHNAVDAIFITTWYITVEIVGKAKGKFIYPFLNLVKSYTGRFCVFLVFLFAILGITKVYMMIKLRRKEEKEVENK